MTQHPTEVLPAYALKCLDPEEFDQVHQHVANCAVCMTEVAQFEQTLAALSHAVPLAEPSPTLKSELLLSLRPKRSFAWFNQLVNRWPRLVPSLGLASLVFAIVFGITCLILMQEPGRFNDQDFYRVQLARFQGTAAMPEANGILLVSADDKQGILVVSALRPLDQTEQYQLWLIKDGQRTSGGVFSVNPNGEGQMTIDAQESLASYDAFGVTIEPYGGSHGPTGPKVLGGMM